VNEDQGRRSRLLLLPLLRRGHCPHPPNGGDSHWICFRHLQRWNQNRARLFAESGGCEMQELGDLLEGCPAAARRTCLSVMCVNPGTLPHRSRTFQRLSNPSCGAESSRLWQALSICRISGIAMIIGQFLARLCWRKFRNACKTTASRASARHEDEEMGDYRALPRCLPQLFARESAAEFLEIDEPLPGACPPSGHDRDLRVPSTLEGRDSERERGNARHRRNDQHRRTLVALPRRTDRRNVHASCADCPEEF
jgi:hypothetical protein